MGYDMRIRGEVDKASQHEIDAAEAAYRAADAVYKERAELARAAGTFSAEFNAKESAEPDRLWAEWRKLQDPSYFRLNMWGMMGFRETMLELGMAHGSEHPIPYSEWPDYHEDEHDEAAMDAYEKRQDALLEMHGDSNKPTIPAHKLSSNDGWIVTPDEIRAALAAWTERDETKLGDESRERVTTDYWGAWIKYLELAAEHDGFRVH